MDGGLLRWESVARGLPERLLTGALTEGGFGQVITRAAGTIWRLVIVPHALHSSSSTPSPRGVAQVSWLPQAGHSMNSNVPSGSWPRHPAGHQ
jgi:hypothetical protein